MDANTYQKLAARTINTELTRAQLEKHALFGMCSELGEIHGLFQKIYQNHDMDSDHLKKECSDLCWFLAEFCTSQGWLLGDVMQLNIDKLIARYPNGFETEKSIHRKEGDI